MNKSIEYLLAQSRKKYQSLDFKKIDWAHGEIETMEEFIKEVYRDAQLNYKPEGFPRENGKLLLFFRELPAEKDGVSYSVPVRVLYNPKAAFNTYLRVEVDKEKKRVDIVKTLVYQIISLQIPVTSGMRKITDYNTQEIVLEAGDIIWATQRETEEPKSFCTVPVRCYARKKELKRI